LDQEGYFLNSNSPQIWGFLIAVMFGYFFNNIILTIVSGLVSFWIFTFLF